jgi:acetyl esterase/lipase
LRAKAGYGNALNMLKYALIALIVAMAGVAIWFIRLGGPAQLNLADRWWPGEPEFHGLVGRGANDDDYLPVEFGKGTPFENCDGAKLPTLIFIHGGSWRDGDRRDYGFVGRAFAARGFITHVIDYSKLPQHRFPAFLKDVSKFIAEKHHNLPPNGCQDPAKIYLMGHSAGAHIAAMVALDPQWLAAHNSDPSIIAGVIGLAGPYDFYPFTSDASKDALGHWPDWQETQPIHYARGDAPPMLLLHGDSDETVKPRNSKALAGAITDKGGVADVKIYKGVNHADIIMAIARPFRKKAPVIDDVIAFTAVRKKVVNY